MKTVHIRYYDMDSNGNIIKYRIKFAQNAKQFLVEIAPENTKEMLHYNDNEDSDVNIYDSYDYKEYVMKEEEDVGGEREKEGEEKNNNSNNSTNSNAYAKSSRSLIFLTFV
jgi:hypothetical protein